jgi:hypothetical protein
VRYVIFGFLVSLAVVFFAGCPSVLAPPEMPVRGSHVLVVQIAGESPASRTALPPKPEVDTYTISVNSGEGGNLGSHTFTAGLESYPVELTRAPKEGDTVKVEGFTGGVDGVKNAEGIYALPPDYTSSSSITITLYPLTEGTGNVNLSVSFNRNSGTDDEITKVTLKLYKSLDDYTSGKAPIKQQSYGMGGTAFTGTDSAVSIPIQYNNLDSGNYVVMIEFFRGTAGNIRVSHLVQTVIVRGGLTTNTWDGVSGPLDWTEDKVASSDANLEDISISGASISFSPTTYSYSVVKGWPEAETPTLSITKGAAGKRIEAKLNGETVSGSLTQLKQNGVNSLIITVTAQDGVTTQTYTVSYTYYNNSWRFDVAEGGNDGTGNGTGYPYKTVTKALEKIKSIYNGGTDWPGGKTNPVAFQINISGEITDAIEIKETGSLYDTLPPILLTGSDTNTNKIIAKESSRPLTITKAAVILGDGLTLTGGNNVSQGGGVHIKSGGSFTMTGGTISGNTATSGGGVYVESGSFTLNGGTISGNTAATSGGGVYVNSGPFTMNGGTISENAAGTSGGGVYIAGNGANVFTMNGGTISGNTATNGGGVYCDGPTFTMSGQSSITGNTAKNGGGGGVYVTSGNFRMSGQSSVSRNAATATGTGLKNGGGVYVASNGSFTMEGGSVDGNNAATNGGGVYIAGSGTFSMSGGSVSGNTAAGTGTTQGGGGVHIAGTGSMSGGDISGNTASNGGGVYVPSSGKFTMTAGSVSGNTATGTGGGGGVYVASSASNNNTFAMSGGSVSGNTATGTGGGGGVFFSGGTFSMQGGALIDQANDVWLAGKTITIQNDLTGTPPVARITPSLYSLGTPVLTGTAVASNYTKFTVTPKDAENWRIDSDGKLQPTPTIGIN